ncbi:MAG: Tex-like N-terminal domain-containing protein [Planctomycetota bacterium]
MTIEIDFGRVARELNLPLESVQNTVALLDEDNTVPFVTRYRKAETGALDEEQIREVQDKVGKLRGLAERKQTILKSLQSQELLTPELEHQIRQAASPKRLEDLYLPYKPKKQTLATVARKRGLEPLALEVLAGDPAVEDLRQRAEALVDPQEGLSSVDEVLQGVQHIVAERFSEHAEVRGRLRKILKQTGTLSCTRMEPPKPETSSSGAEGTSSETPADLQPPSKADGESPSQAGESTVPPAALSPANSEAGPAGTARPPAGVSGEDAMSAEDATDGIETPGPAHLDHEQAQAGPASGESGEDSLPSPQTADPQAEATALGGAQSPPSEATQPREQNAARAASSTDVAAGEPSGEVPPPMAEASAGELGAIGGEGKAEPAREDDDLGTDTEGDGSAAAAAGSSDVGRAEAVGQAEATQAGKPAQSTRKQGGKPAPLSASMAKKAKKRKRLEAAAPRCPRCSTKELF